MKKLIRVTILSTIASIMLASCDNEVTKENEEVLKVGMITDSGTIDDKSFNQGTWEGIKLYESENVGVIEKHFVQPNGETNQDYMRAYQDLVDAGYEFIISPGYKFEEAVYMAQNQYPDVNFMIIDGTPKNEDGKYIISDNTQAVYFAEEEAGFYAGVIAAMASETGHVSYIGGVRVPSVERFGYGYVAGVAYANEVYGTDVTVEEYIYAESFVDTAKGKTFAGQFYDNSSDVIFTAAGGVGIGVIEEAKTRKTEGGDVWVIGVDVDQYNDGLVGDESVILTSAVKGLSQATYTAIDEVVNGEFKGGETVILDSSQNAVGIPEENPNLTEEMIVNYESAKQEVVAGNVVVPENSEELEYFLTEYNYETPSTVQY